MQYVLQRPSTYCMIQTCKSAPLFEFTIHGLWPSKSDGNTLYQTPPPGMLENVFIHQEDMKVYTVMQANHSLRDKLQTIWPNLKVCRSDEWLWMHEWRQHGYSIESVLDVTGFFNAAKMINELIVDNLLTYLKDEEINTSDHQSYEINKIRSAITHLVGDYTNQSSRMTEIFLSNSMQASTTLLALFVSHLSSLIWSRENAKELLRFLRKNRQADFFKVQTVVPLKC
ncbi:hypothetical protein H5410_013907 [Solanum commersonii]|uniref:Uncharacterized protein n=1 Tax=Solanum commersonii TaxID=4109 RepID=A0A9J5ZPP3_SOLCO|nr:hypothetical protein H5410_013907 [Solanum commersonii]